MEKELKDFINNIRNLTIVKGIEEASIDKLRKQTDYAQQLKKHKIDTDEQLVALILENERHMFEVIFQDYNFDGNEDAIEILFTVSKEMSRNFSSLTPSFTHGYKESYPQIYQEHLSKRLGFIDNKIQINLRKGIGQGMYRDDLSVELVARRYMSRLLDLHDQDSFPPEQFSFTTLFNQMFDNFVVSIATEKGMKYYNKKKKSADF